ncbi:MAG: patatin-like phospholipase family protein [Desulfobacterales bacterium]|nr:patatin-like phospholipase family protein [Desulfobacterales bacterium]
MKRLHCFSILFLCLLFTGCASLKPKNIKLENYESGVLKQKDRGEILLLLSFSGGGTRAASLSYGVLEELRDTYLNINGNKISLLDEVDHISAVSGGSFTAAYYGLFGDNIFEDYTDIFLERNIQKNFILSLFNPINWFRSLFSGFNRTEHAIEYYDKYIFKGATFADLQKRAGPQIEINATDLNAGQRFSFTQDQFNLLCSDLSSLRVAQAVTASSTVPVVFPPVVLKNYGDSCSPEKEDTFLELSHKDEDDTRKIRLINNFLSYKDSAKRPYIHLVDGGISDNLGLHALIDYVSLGGGIKNVVELSDGIPKTVVVILVNAKTEPEKTIDHSPRKPALSEVVSAVSKTQIERYSLETISLVKESLTKWADELSTENIDIEPHFIEVSFEGIKAETFRNYFNNIATTLTLPPEEVQLLRKAGHTLLRESPEFQELIEEFR